MITTILRIKNRAYVDDRNISKFALDCLYRSALLDTLLILRIILLVVLNKDMLL